MQLEKLLIFQDAISFTTLTCGLGDFSFRSFECQSAFPQYLLYFSTSKSPAHVMSQSLRSLILETHLFELVCQFLYPSTWDLLTVSVRPAYLRTHTLYFIQNFSPE